MSFPSRLTTRSNVPRLVPGQKRADVGVDIHAPSVDLIKLVADLKSLYEDSSGQPSKKPEILAVEKPATQE